MKHLAIVLLVVACGKSDKGGGAVADGGSWKIGEIEVPNAAIPQKLDVPTILPAKIGGEVLSGEMSAMAMVSDKLNVQYVFADPPNDEVVRGYQAMIYTDPLSALEAKWGPSTEKAGTSYDLARCWAAADKKIEACVYKNDGQNHWYVTTLTTAPLPDRPATPIPPEPAGAYVDHPVGIGPCSVVGIKEVSEIVGAQMQYLQPEATDMSCHLLPAIGATAARVPGQVTEAEAVKQVPDILVMRQDASRASWSDQPIEGLGEKATWEGLSVQFKVKELMYRVRVTDPAKAVRVLKDRALQIARKVAARATAAPE